VADILANRAHVAKRFGEGAVFVSPLQVHGAHVEVITEPRQRGWDALERTFEADALVTDQPNVVLTILTADCVPILLYDRVRQAIGAVHAGWRGAHKGIVHKTLKVMSEAFGTDPADLIVGIGPAIGGCCYEVGGEVAMHFEAYPDAITPKKNGKYLLDTKQINVQQLIEVGVPKSHIETSPICTLCEHERFFSYRADKTAGRFMSCIMLLGGK
jgi:YfiH family protein